MKKIIIEIIDAIETAQTWTGWDWSHDPAVCTCDMQSGREHTEGPRDAEYFITQGHSEDCAERMAEAEQEYDKECREDAQAAYEHGDNAIDALKDGRIEDAKEELEEACGHENTYGGSPCYTTPLEMLREMIAKIDSPEPAQAKA
jgi:hypothetical protein